MKRVLTIVIAALVLVFPLSACGPKTPDVPSSTSKNIEIVHKIYEKDELDNYSKETLYNFGLSAEGSYSKQWNGTWVVTEDFVKEYVEKYSAEEFVGVYTRFVANYLCAGDLIKDEDFYGDNPQLLEYISETTQLMFKMTESFEVVSIHPATDEVLNETSETKEVSGRFNVGSDNHIETRTAHLTTDTYEYSGYTVIHRHGKEYCSGEYGWVNGDFHDVKPYFADVDDYSLHLDGKGTVSEGKTLEELNCEWISIGGTEYFKRTIYGTSFYSSHSKETITTPFLQPVYILTTSAMNACEKYLDY